MVKWFSYMHKSACFDLQCCIHVWVSQYITEQVNILRTYIVKVPFYRFIYTGLYIYMSVN